MGIKKQIRKAIHTASYKLGKMIAAGADPDAIKDQDAFLENLLETQFLLNGGQKRTGRRK